MKVILIFFSASHSVWGQGLKLKIAFLFFGRSNYLLKYTLYNKYIPKAPSYLILLVIPEVKSI